MRPDTWTKFRKSMTLGILVLGFLFLGQGLQAQEFPTQSINLIIDRPPGSGTDVVGRVIAPAASKILGQEIIPVNKPGGRRRCGNRPPGQCQTGWLQHPRFHHERADGCSPSRVGLL